MKLLRQLLGLHKLQKPPAASVEVIQLKQSKSTYFNTEVVGESHYTRNLQRIAPRLTDGDSEMVIARLILDDNNPHDNQAVRVEINGLPVGHLSRAEAPAYRAHLQKIGKPGVVGECRAKVRGTAAKGIYGVYLDVPFD